MSDGGNGGHGGAPLGKTGSDTAFGQDVVFRLPNPKVRFLLVGLFLVALGVGVFLVPARHEGKATLMKILGALIAPFGAFMAYKGVTLFGVKEGEAVVSAKELTYTPAGAVSQTIALETIERVLHASQGGQRSYVTFETSDGKRFVLSAAHLAAEDEHRLAGLVLRRSELRRAGVKSRAELAAAETFLACSAAVGRPFAIEVTTEGKKVTGTRVIATRDDVTPTSENEKRQLFVPAPVLAVLKADDAVLASAKPLRGVS